VNEWVWVEHVTYAGESVSDDSITHPWLDDTFPPDQYDWLEFFFTTQVPAPKGFSDTPTIDHLVIGKFVTAPPRSRYSGVRVQFVDFTNTGKKPREHSSCSDI